MEELEIMIKSLRYETLELKVFIEIHLIWSHFIETFLKIITWKREL